LQAPAVLRLESGTDGASASSLPRSGPTNSRKMVIAEENPQVIALTGARKLTVLDREGAARGGAA